MRTTIGLVVVMTAATACSLFDSGPDTTTTTDESTGVPTGGATEQGPCMSGDDCPFPVEQCKGPTCVDGVCGGEFLADGTPWYTDTPGDCRIDVCDGAGGIKSVLGDDPPPQNSGDCQRLVCKNGEAVADVDATDVPNDANECTVDTCEMMTIPTNTPVAVNTACSEGFCHGDTVCRHCQEVSEDCEDIGSEPHENQENAQNLGQINDADASGSFVCGTLKGANDVDWYTYSGKDALGNQVDPSRSMFAQIGVGRVCVYMQCNGGNATSVGCNGAQSDTAPLGQKGCCALEFVKPSLNCDGLDDSARVWIRVDNPQALACVPYELAYHF
jgi:hypothetical protein